jgi:hypothetical protein
MLSRTLILAAVALWIGGVATPAAAQNLEAGKTPSQLFAATCSLCHKSTRGLVKTVAPGSLPAFLRQHYTTSQDMATALSAYVLSNGASDKRIGEDNLTREGKESRTLPKPGEPEAEPKNDARAKPGRGAREAKKPEADEKEKDVAPKADEAPKAAGAPEPAIETNGDQQAKDKKSKLERRKPKPSVARGDAQGDAKQKPAVVLPEPRPEVRPETPEEKPPAAPADTAKVDSGTRPDPVPAVTPAPEASPSQSAPAAVASPNSDAGPKTADDKSSAPNPNMPVFNIEPQPAPAPQEPARPPAGTPRVPVSN